MTPKTVNNYAPISHNNLVYGPILSDSCHPWMFAWRSRKVVFVFRRSRRTNGNNLIFHCNTDKTIRVSRRGRFY